MKCDVNIIPGREKASPHKVQVTALALSPLSIFFFTCKREQILFFPQVGKCGQFFFFGVSRLLAWFKAPLCTI